MLGWVDFKDPRVLLDPNAPRVAQVMEKVIV